MLIRGTRVPHLHMLLIPSIKGEENLLDKTLAMHHFAQARMKPPFSEPELDTIAEQVRNAEV
jgi:diadenosine tetraphosphate (Ap4A) HIT family hydrolase